VRRLAPGQACPYGIGCVGYAYCYASAVCVLKMKLGEACDASAGSEACLLGLSCSNGLCVQPAPAPVCP
jgi:hypothetical protein